MLAEAGQLLVSRGAYPNPSGCTTSVLYVRLKSVSPLLELEVVRYNYIIVGNSITQAPFDLVRLFLRPLRMILFHISVWPLACGCDMEVKRRCNRFSSHRSLKGLPSNWVLFSFIKTSRVSNLVTMCLDINVVIYLPVTVAKGSASIHLVK